MSGTAIPPRPVALPVQAGELPPILRSLRRFVGWSYTWKPGNGNGKPGKWDKPPYVATDPERLASSTDPDTWRTFKEARAAVEDGKLDGLGITLGPVETTDDAIAASNRLTAVDLDHCIDDHGTIVPWAHAIIDRLNTYTERSPSGRGIRMLLWADCLPPSGRKGRDVEIYNAGRYVTLTGHRLAGTPTEPQERTDAIAAVHAEVFGTNSNGSRQKPRRRAGHVTDDDATLLDRARLARNGEKFAALFWAGDTSAYRSPSEADLALCGHLAFWTDRDAARVDALFRQSGLMRPKWDERRGDRTYGELTIEKTISDCRETYRGPSRPVARSVSDTTPATVPPVTAATPAGAQELDDRPAPEAPTIEEAPPFAIVTPAASFVTRYIEHVSQRTDAPPEAHELMALGILSALAGPRPRIPIATSTRGDRLVLWTTYIVNSTIGRKTTTINFARDLLATVLGENAIIEWEGSPQGLIQRLQERDNQAAVFVRDEYSGLLQQMNRGGHMAGLEQTFIRSFDGRVLENIRTRKRNKTTGEWHRDTDRVENPYLVKLTGTTWNAFIARATIDNVLDGFLARFIFVTGSAAPRRPGSTTPAIEADWTALIQAGRDYYERARLIDVLNVDNDVLDASWALEQQWAARARQSTRPDAATPSLKRLAEAVLKVAGLLAIEDTSIMQPCITLDHFRMARAMGERWITNTLQVIEALGATSFQREADAVADTVRQHPHGIKLSDLYRAHRRLKKRDFDEILSALETQEVIGRVEADHQGKGRPPVAYRPGRRTS